MGTHAHRLHRQFAQYEQFEIFSSGYLHAPVDHPDQVSDVTMTGFGIRNIEDTFNKGWQFVYGPQAGEQFLYTFFNGRLKYFNRGGSHWIMLKFGDPFIMERLSEELPWWMPFPQYVLYQGVDMDEVENDLYHLLIQDPNLTDLLYMLHPGTSFDPHAGLSTKAMHVIDMLKNEQLRNGFPIQYGSRIGMFGENGNAGERQGTIYMLPERLETGDEDPLSTESGLDDTYIKDAIDQILNGISDHEPHFFIDPGFIHLHYASYFAQPLQNHPLYHQLINCLAGPTANGIIRYVSKNSSSPGSSGFQDRQAPAHSLKQAVDVADANDTVVIMDTETYEEGEEIVIAKPLNITSLANVNLSGVSDNLPMVTGNEEYRGFLIDFSDHTIAGVLSITNIGVEKGLGHQSPSCGGGISIKGSNQVYIARCCIRHNSLEGDHWGGGGIGMISSSPFIYHNDVHHNQTGGRGAGIGAIGYGWPYISDNHIHDNHAVAGGHQDGGGIGIVVAQPTNFNDLDHFLATVDDLSSLNVLRSYYRGGWDQAFIDWAKRNYTKIFNNTIENNVSNDDGGGVYLSVIANAHFRNNQIRNNKARNAAGGVRLSMASSVIMEGDTIQGNESNSLLKKVDPAHGGGGIAARNSNLTLRNVTVKGNKAFGWAGGGLFFNASQSGSASIASYDRIMKYVFEPDRYSLRIEGNTKIEENECVYVIAYFDPEENEWKEAEADRRKGGGVYVLRAVDTSNSISPPVYPVALPVIVAIDRINGIRNNEFTSINPPVNYTGNADVPIPTNHYLNIYYEDQVLRNGDPIHDGNKNEFTNESGRFVYLSLDDEPE